MIYEKGNEREMIITMKDNTLEDKQREKTFPLQSIPILNPP
jgi:hypothetical protein